MNSDKLRIKELEDQIAEKDRTIHALQNSIDQLTKKVQLLTEAILQMRHDKYGPSSEKRAGSNSDENQLCFFNEIEIEAADDEEPFEADSKGKAKAIKRRVRRDFVIGDIPIEEVVIELEGDELVCDICGNTLREIGKKFVREELQYIPSRLKIIRYFEMSYECPKCKHGEKPFIITALTPVSLLNHSLASPSSVAYVMYQKYVQGVPLYRQEKEWETMGIMLSRATMANWVIRCYEEYFIPVIAHMKKILLSCDIIHADETPVQVLKENGKKPQTKSYMWVYRTGECCGPPIILYDYQPSRSGKNPAEYLKGFKGYLHSDGYSGYNAVSGIIRCGCWAHLRRKFLEAVPKNNRQEKSGSLAEIGVDYCSRLFKIEDQIKNLNPEEKYIRRLELEKPVLEAFWSWLETVNALPQSKLGKAVTYARNQKKYMGVYEILSVNCLLWQEITYLKE